MISVQGRFAKRHRLTRSREFQHVFASANSFSSRTFTILVRNNGRDYPRLGLIVSKKCTKSAVIRNRIKRIVRESFRQHMPRLPGVDIIVIARRDVVKTPSQAVHNALADKWAEIAQWKGL